MPSLKQLTCSVELGSSNTKIPEYGKDYGDADLTMDGVLLHSTG
jgi:hypothetical protein